MKELVAAGVLAGCIALGAFGCAGDGSALIDDTMNGGNGNGEAPTLALIQSTIFTPICTDCHNPGGPGNFMPLDSEDASFAGLVGVPSIEVALLRVEPGDPEQSYLVHKIEDRPGIVFTRMPPPPQPMLSAEQIETIRGWIEAGAER